MSLQEAKKIQTKAELLKVISNSAIEFAGEYEASTEATMKKALDAIRVLRRGRRDVYVVLLTRRSA